MDNGALDTTNPSENTRPTRPLVETLAEATIPNDEFPFPFDEENIPAQPISSQVEEAPNNVKTKVRRLDSFMLRVDKMANKVNRRIDQVQKARYERMLRNARNRLSDDRAGQERRMESRFIGRFTSANRKMDADLKLANKEMRKVEKSAIRTGDALNRKVGEYNSRMPQNLQPLTIIEPGEPEAIRNSKLQNILNTAEQLHGFDDITATELTNLVNDLKAQTYAYGVARDKRDRAYEPHRYLGTNNSRRQQDRIIESDQNISSAQRNLDFYDRKEQALEQRMGGLNTSLEPAVGRRVASQPEYVGEATVTSLPVTREAGSAKPDTVQEIPPSDLSPRSIEILDIYSRVVPFLQKGIPQDIAIEMAIKKIPSDQADLIKAIVEVLKASGSNITNAN